MAKAITSDWLLMADTIGLAKNKKRTVTKAINIMLYFAVIHTLFSALSGSFAPRFWPTSVAAALLNPQAGNRKKERIRNAIVYPAMASLPKPAMILARKSQLAVAIKN